MNGLPVVGPPFDIVGEVEPPSHPDLRRLHDQVDALGSVATRFLVPDNHTGRATVSSISVAHEVLARGGRAMACLNARDRNLLGFRRDLLTASFYGIEDVLLVHGDAPEVGERAGGLTVRAMLAECRRHGADHAPLRAAVTTGLRPVPAWKREADALFVQVAWSIDPLLAWRESIDFDGPVYPAVLVVPSAAMARRLSARVPELAVPESWIAAVEADPAAGVARAAELVEAIRASGAFAGVHLIAGVRYREVAAGLTVARTGAAAAERPAGVVAG